jgi:Protein of unknown function (DUF2635)
MKVKPAPGITVVRDPHSKLPLPAEGAEVADDSIFWNRRLIAGDVVRVADAPPMFAPIAPLTTRGGK